MADDNTRQRGERNDRTASLDEMLARVRKRQAKADIENGRRRKKRAGEKSDPLARPRGPSPPTT